MTISKQYNADEQTYVVSISKSHINTIRNDYMRQYRNSIVPILACLLGTPRGPPNRPPKNQFFEWLNLEFQCFMISADI